MHTPQTCTTLNCHTSDGYAATHPWHTCLCATSPLGAERNAPDVAGLEDMFASSDDPAWMDRALCAQTDPEAFFPEKGRSARAAKATCASCEVRADCLDYALANSLNVGIWGGLAERERRAIMGQLQKGAAA